MLYNNIDFNVIYIDPSISTPGDGSSPIDALNNLPLGIGGFADNTCYLIRRTAEAVNATLTNGTANQLTNFIIMGMPKPDDWIYGFVPEAAKTAWSDDEAEYANVRSTANIAFTLPNIKNFLLHRVFLFREGLDVSAYIFNFSNDQYTSILNFENCKFGSRGINFDRANYTTVLTTARCRGYIQVKYPKVFNFTNNVLLWGPVGSSSGTHGVYLEDAVMVNVNHVKIYAVMTDNNRNSIALNFGVTNSAVSEGRFENIDAEILFNSTYEVMPRILSTAYYSQFTLRNLAVNITRSISGATPARAMLTEMLISCTNNREFTVDGIIINMPGCWYVDSGGRAFHFGGYYSSNVPGNEKIIRNITINMEDTNGLDTTYNGGYYSWVQSTNLGYYAVLGLVFTDRDDQYFAKPIVAENITVNHPRGVALYGDNLQIRNSRFKGAVKLTRCIADIESIESWYPGYALMANTYSTIRVERITVNLENPIYPDNSDPVIGTNYDSNYFIYVEHCNARLRSNLTYNTNTPNQYNAVCANEVDPGHFVQRSMNVICDTWSVYRDGGAPASLKIANNAYNTTTQISIGRHPFRGIQLIPATTGKHELRVHIAAKSFSNMPELGSRFIVQATTRDGMILSSVHGQWLDDPGSVWHFDANLTQNVLIMPLDLTALDPVDVKFHFNWYSATGVLYVDPAVELKPVTETEEEA